MNYYSKIYFTLCESKKQEKSNYFRFSGLHKHHILPKHSGGNDDDENLTYLTVREHIIAHFLLWKIYKNPNDLRSMKMLGANLTPQKRKIVGQWCRDNKIGFHKNSREEKSCWAKKGLETQKNSKSENTFYYWTTKEGRKKRASLGGKNSIRSPNNPWSYWASQEGRKERASLGGKSHKGKKVMHKPGDESFIRVHDNDVQNYISMGYIFGSPIPSKSKNIKTNIPSPRRRKVSDGKKIYESVHEAAEKNNVTPGAIVYRCKSKKSTWHYFYDT